MIKEHLNSHTSSPELNMKNCVRCQGFLVSIHLMDVQQLGLMWEQEQRCINCGWISPPMILKRHRETNRGKKRTKKSSGKELRSNKLGSTPFRRMSEAEILQ